MFDNDVGWVLFGKNVLRKKNPSLASGSMLQEKPRPRIILSRRLSYTLTARHRTLVGVS